MADRHWGVVKAPGTAINEYAGVPRIIDGILGGSVLIGACQKGDVGKLTMALSWPDFQKKLGDIVPFSYLPHAAKGYFSEGQGNGRLYVLRVSDGTEASADLTLSNIAGTNVLKITAKSPGSWGGKRAFVSGVTGVSLVGSAFTVLFPGTPEVVPPDGTLSGGYLQKQGDPANPKYNIISQIGKVITTDIPYAGGATDSDLACWVENSLPLYILVKPSSLDPDKWNLSAYYNGSLVANYEGLTLDPNSPSFCESVINSDKTNYYFTVESLYTGVLYDKTTMPRMEIATITTVTAATKTLVLNVATLITGLGNVDAFAPEYAGGTLKKIDTTTGVTTGSWRIKSSEKTYSGTGPYTEVLQLVLEGSVGATDFSPADVVLLEGALGLGNGFDGKWVANATDLGTQILDTMEISTSPIKDLRSLENGLLKVAVPGYSESTDREAISKAGMALAEAFNYQFRYEAQQSDDYQTFKETAEGTYGRSPWVVCNFPGWGQLIDDGVLYTVPVIGDILGEEARIATAYKGYYKAEAGVDAVLSRFLGLVVGTDTDYEMPTEVMEYLNPAGVNCLVKKYGNIVIWGDRTFASDSVWRWKHMREQMSHYEQVLLYSNDWVNFAVNNSALWPVLYGYLANYFRPEYRKGALYGKTFDEACLIIVDSTNNNQATIDDGDVHAEVILQFSGTVERVVIGMGRAAITEKVLS